jgi:hypothetical protein
VCRSRIKLGNRADYAITVALAVGIRYRGDPLPQSLDRLGLSARAIVADCQQREPHRVDRTISGAVAGRGYGQRDQFRGRSLERVGQCQDQRQVV